MITASSALRIIIVRQTVEVHSVRQSNYQKVRAKDDMYKRKKAGVSDPTKKAIEVFGQFGLRDVGSGREFAYETCRFSCQTTFKSQPGVFHLLGRSKTKFKNIEIFEKSKKIYLYEKAVLLENVQRRQVKYSITKFDALISTKFDASEPQTTKPKFAPAKISEKTSTSLRRL